MLLETILNDIYFGNSVLNYVKFIAAILLGLILIFIFNLIFLKKKKLIISAFDRLTGRIVEVKLQKYINPLLYTALFYSSIKTFLNLSDKMNRALYIIFIIIITYYAVRLFSAAAKTALTSYLKKSARGFHDVERRVKGISTFNDIIIWTFGIIFVISNSGLNISAVITGLGIGGVALALASQNIFRDFFNYFVIFFDQPFQIGDLIAIDNLTGTVEKIGIKTTRIRSLEGEEIIISNSDLTGKQIHNYKKMEKRRVVFTISIADKTISDKLISIPDIMKKIVDNTGNTKFVRAYFKEFRNSSPVFEIVYYVLSPDYNLYIEVQQKINFSIFREFKEAGIELA